MKTLFARFWPADSFWHRRDPLAKLFFVLWLAAAVAMARTLPILLALGGVTAVLWLTARLPGRAFLSAVRSFSWLVLAALFTSLFFGRGWPPRPTAASTLAAGMNLLRFSILIGLGTWLAGTTTALDLAGAFLRAAAPLGRLGLPDDEFALVAGLGLRLLPELLEAGARIRLAQRARGLGTARGLRARLAAAEALAVALFSYAFRRADELALAMEARGYSQRVHGPGRRGTVKNRRDRLLFFLGPAAAAASWWLGRVMG